MSWLLDRSSPSLLWEASLLTSFFAHALLGLVLLMLWPEPEQLSRNTILVELVTLPEPAGSAPQPVNDTPTQRASATVTRDKPGAQPVRVSPAPTQQPMPKSSLQSAVTEQAASHTSQDKLRPDNDIFKPAAAEPAQTQSAAPAAGKSNNNAAADRSASASSSTTADLESVKAAYLRSIASLIDRQKSYPLMARKGRQQGIVNVVFTLDQNGLLDNCQVKESSGFRPLDQAALKAVRQVRRYPEPPPTLGEKPSFQIAISFRLED
jgi:protein TonB